MPAVFNVFSSVTLAGGPDVWGVLMRYTVMPLKCSWPRTMGLVQEESERGGECKKRS